MKVQDTISNVRRDFAKHRTDLQISYHYPSDELVAVIRFLLRTNPKRKQSKRKK